MKTVLLALCFILFLFNINSIAHVDKKHDIHKKTVEVDSVSLMNNTNVIKKDSVSKIEEHQHEEQIEVPYKLDIFLALTEHLHNKIVHFTVGLSLIAFLMTLINFKWKTFDSAIRFLVIFSAISSLLTLITGQIQFSTFLGDPKEWVVKLHQKLGYAAVIMLWIWSGFLINKTLKKYAWLIGAIVFLLISITGFFGGIAAH